MSNATNPYAAPVSNVVTAPGTDCWREGKLVVVRRGGDLPHRCVRCNAATSLPKKRTYTWHSPWLYLLVLFNLIIYAIVALIVRKKEKISPGLCSSHGRQRVLFILLSILSVFFCVAALAVAAVEKQDLMYAGALLALVGAFVFGSKGSLPGAARIDDQHIKLRGCDPRFLASLPESGH